MRNKATRTNEWEREHFGGSPLDPFESSKGYSTDGGAAVTLWDEMVAHWDTGYHFVPYPVPLRAFCFGGGTPDCLSVGASSIFVC